MRLNLARPIAEFFAAENTCDADALAGCFVDHGVVHDEGGTFEGTNAIRDWNAAAREKYHHTVEPMSAIERDGATIVAGKVSGDFPGSPVTLDHVFRLAGDKILSLTIR